MGRNLTGPNPLHPLPRDQVFRRIAPGRRTPSGACQLPPSARQSSRADRECDFGTPGSRSLVPTDSLLGSGPMVERLALYSARQPPFTR